MIPESDLKLGELRLLEVDNSFVYLLLHTFVYY